MRSSAELVAWVQDLYLAMLYPDFDQHWQKPFGDRDDDNDSCGFGKAHYTGTCVLHSPLDEAIRLRFWSGKSHEIRS